MDEKTFQIMIDNEVKKTIKKIKKMRQPLEKYLDEIVQDIIANYDNMYCHDYHHSPSGLLSDVHIHHSRLYLARPLKRKENFDVNLVVQWFALTFPTSKCKIQIKDHNTYSYQQWFLDFSNEDKRKLFAMKHDRCLHLTEDLKDHDNRIPTKDQTEILKTYEFPTYDCKAH